MTPQTLSVLLFLIGFFSKPEGFGNPLVAAYLYKVANWSTQDIGIVQALSTVCFAVLCPFAGNWMDRFQYKTCMFCAACAVISFTTSSVIVSQDFWWILITRILQGAAQAFIPPGISSITLGVLGRDSFSNQMALNAAGNSIGNLLGVLAAAVASFYSGPECAFYLGGAYNAICAICCMLIPAESIQHDVACQMATEEDSETDGKYSKYTIATFLFIICSFHMANAAMLPLLCQQLSHDVTDSEGLMLSNAAVGVRSVFGGCILLLVSRTQVAHRKGLGYISLFALVVRGIILAAIASSSVLVFKIIGLSSQVLDAVADELFEWTKTVIIRDMTEGTGHFNLVIGLGNFAIEIGAAISNFVAESVVGVESYAFAYSILAVTALVPLACFTIFIPETYEEQSRLGTEGSMLTEKEEKVPLDPAASVP